MGQYAAGIAYLGGHPRYKEAVEGVYNFCGGGGEDLPDEATLLRSMRTLIPSISKQQVSFSFNCLSIQSVNPLWMSASITNFKSLKEGIKHIDYALNNLR